MTNSLAARLTGSAECGRAIQDTQVQWYAAYTRVRHEKSVARQLADRQVDCFLPVYRSLRRWKDRRKELELALFPGYVFVHIAQRAQLAVLQVPSVVSLVNFQGRPAPIPNTEIESLRRGLSGQARVEPHPYLTIGRRVRITHGPLAGAEGLLDRRKDSFRVVLSINLLMRSVSVEVDESEIEPIF